MAIWHYEIILLPADEVHSYCNNESLTQEMFEKIDWWKYKNLNSLSFQVFNPLLSESNENWSKEIVMFGLEDKNNICLFYNERHLVEINVRIDIKDYINFVNLLVEFCLLHNLLYLDSEMKIHFPSIHGLKYEIEQYKKKMPF